MSISSLQKEGEIMKKSLFALFLTVALALFLGTAQSMAKDFPSKPITYIIPFNPGGQSDVTAQVQKADLKKLLGVPVIITYKPGAGGAVAWSQLARSIKPDGYTICGNNIPHIILQPLLRKDAGYKTEDLVPIVMFETTPIGLAVLKDKPWKTLKDFIESAKANPGKITVGGCGKYTGHHITFLMLQKLAGIKLTYVSFTGAAPSVANFLGGHVDALLGNSNDLLAHKDKIRILAIGTEERAPWYKEVPTFIEQGINMTAGIDRGVCAPPGIPPDRLAVLEKAFLKLSKSESYRNKMFEMGFIPRALGSKEFAAYIQKQKQILTNLLKEMGILK